MVPSAGQTEGRCLHKTSISSRFQSQRVNNCTSVIHWTVGEIEYVRINIDINTGIMWHRKVIHDTPATIVLGGTCILIPATLCREVTSAIHAAYIGIEGSIWMAHDQCLLVYNEFRFKYNITLNRAFVTTWWARIGVNLCELKKCMLLVNW